MEIYDSALVLDAGTRTVNYAIDSDGTLVFFRSTIDMKNITGSWSVGMLGNEVIITDSAVRITNANGGYGVMVNSGTIFGSTIEVTTDNDDYGNYGIDAANIAIQNTKIKAVSATQTGSDTRRIFFVAT